MDNKLCVFVQESGLETTHAQQIAEELAEIERLRKKEEEKKERLRIQKENERLRKEAEEKEREIVRIRKEEEEKRIKENAERIAKEKEEARRYKTGKIKGLEGKMLEELDFLFERIGDEFQLTQQGKRVYDFIIKFIK